MDRSRCMTVTPARKRRSPDKMISSRKRKSLRLQHSMSLNIPIEELDSTGIGLHCFIDLPRQVFSLTYLEDNQTQNPESLGSLEELRKKTWQTYLVGYLYNFTYHATQVNSLKKALNNALSSVIATDDPNLKYDSEVDITEELSPTENDCNTLVITISDVSEELDQKKLLYKGYLLSWCNPVKASGTMLPVLLCRGRKKVRNVVHCVLSERFDMVPRPLTLMQEDMIHLSTYCLIMLSENDSGLATLCYKIPTGTMKLVVPVPDLLKLWSCIHRGDTDEVDLDEVLLFHDALEKFCETTFGITLNSAQFIQMKINNYFSLRVNSEIWSCSTKIMHVLLKYLNYMAVQRLRVKTLEHIHQTPASDVSSSRLKSQ